MTEKRPMGRIARRVRRSSLCLAVFATTSYAQMSQIAAAPDGRALMAAYGKGDTLFLYSISLTTHNATRLTAAKTGKESTPSFSADGAFVAYSYVSEKRSQKIIVVNTDGSNSRSVSESDTANLCPTFAKDGKKIYFIRSQLPPLDHAWDIFSVDVDGKNVQRLSHKNFYRISQPSISLDGKSMAVITVGADSHRQIEIYSLEHPEQPVRSLQPHVPGEASRDPIIDYPNYMPDGKSILFMAATNKLSGLDYDIYRVDIATGRLERLTKGNGIASDLRVSADGKLAMFLKWHTSWRRRPNKSQLYILELANLKSALFKVKGL